MNLREYRIGAARSAGLSLVEVAIVVAISGLVLQGVVKGQELIHNARVRDIMAQQAAVEQAVLAFQDRFHALPGDYSEANLNLACGPGACPNGTAMEEWSPARAARSTRRSWRGST